MEVEGKRQKERANEREGRVLTVTYSRYLILALAVRIVVFSHYRLSLFYFCYLIFRSNGSGHTQHSLVS